MSETKNIPISKLVCNTGQIDGLPKNPRYIKDYRFEALKRSIQDAPEMLALRELIVVPYNGKYVVIGGNMRLKACKEIGYAELPCKVLDENTPVEKLREYTIKDNIGFGADDMDALANEWDDNELLSFGMELPNFNSEDLEDEAAALDEKGEIQFSNELDKESNYVVLKFTKDIDWIWCKSILELKSVYSKRQNGKEWSCGIGRVVDGVEAIKKIMQAKDEQQ